MRKKTLVAGLVAAGLLAAVGGLLIWMAWPSPYRRAYDAIRFDMSEAAVEAILGPLLINTIQAGPTVTFDWQGVGDGGPRHVWGGDQEERNDPTLKSSRLAALLNSTREPAITAPGRGVYKSPQTGEPEYTLREVGCGVEVMFVVFDRDGRVVEKAYARMQSPSLLVETGRAIFGRFWPF